MNREEVMRMRRIIMQASESLPDEVAETVPGLFERWYADTDYVVGDRRRYNDTLYKCIMAHHSQSDWTPDVAVSLWVLTSDPCEEWPEWIQPTGAANPYMLGDKVSHNGQHWISNVNNNVWEPGVYGWDAA